MRTTVILTLTACLMLAAPCLGQGFSASFTNAYPLTVVQNGPIPVPDGTPVYVFHDANNATHPGHDPTDQLACVCGNSACTPQTCHNRNQFNVNGAAFGLPGAFASPDYLTRLTMPSPACYYLVVETGEVRWVSRVVTVVAGPQDFYFDQPDWICEIITVPCDGISLVFFRPDPDSSQACCATICRDPGFVHVCVGPIANPGTFPVIAVSGGCDSDRTRCNEDCPPAAGFIWDESDWQWMMTDGMYYYCTTITLPIHGTEGCICILLHRYLDAAPPKPEIHAAGVSLHANYPNPFNVTTQIEFSLTATAQVTLEVYNLTGLPIITLADAPFPAGTHTIAFDGANYTSGTYFYRLTAGNFSDTKKMLLIK